MTLRDILEKMEEQGKAVADHDINDRLIIVILMCVC
jgi:hypothetical protein